MLVEVSLPVSKIQNLRRVGFLNPDQKLADIVNPVESLYFHEQILVIDRALADLFFDLSELYNQVALQLQFRLPFQFRLQLG